MPGTYTGRLIVSVSDDHFEEVALTLRKAGYTVQSANDRILFVYVDESDMKQQIAAINAVTGVQTVEPDYLITNS